MAEFSPRVDKLRLNKETTLSRCTSAVVVMWDLHNTMGFLYPGLHVGHNVRLKRTVFDMFVNINSERS